MLPGFKRKGVHGVGQQHVRYVDACRSLCFPSPHNPHKTTDHAQHTTHQTHEAQDTDSQGLEYSPAFTVQCSRIKQKMKYISSRARRRWGRTWSSLCSNYLKIGAHENARHQGHQATRCGLHQMHLMCDAVPDASDTRDQMHLIHAHACACACACDAVSDASDTRACMRVRCCIRCI